jgi:hypothetical protein
MNLSASLACSIFLLGTAAGALFVRLQWSEFRDRLHKEISMLVMLKEHHEREERAFSINGSSKWKA